MDSYLSRDRPANELIPSTDDHKLLYGTSRVSVHCKRVGMKTTVQVFTVTCVMFLCKNINPLYHFKFK